MRALEERIAEAEANVRRAWAILHPQWRARYSFRHLEPGPPALQLPEPFDFGAPDIQASCDVGGDATACLDALAGELRRVADAPPRRLDLARQDTHFASSTVLWNPLNARVIPLIRSARDAVSAEQDRARARTRELLLAVARAYYGASATREAVAAARRARTRAEAELAQLESKQDAGEGAGLAVRAARIGARQGALDLARAENAHQQALLALATLTRSEERPEVVPPPEPAIPAGTPADLTAAAWSHRPDLAAAEALVRVAEGSREEVWLSFLPVIGFFGGYRWSNVAGITGAQSQWSMGIMANLTLYDGGRRYADLDTAEARVRTARLALEGAKVRIAAEVERSLLAVEAADLAVERAQGTVALAEQNQELARLRSEIGAIRQLDVEQAGDALLDAELGVIRARLDRAMAILELQYAVGELDP